MRLNKLSPQKKSKKLKKRLGRGIGSGLGKTGGRGHKGQLSRSGKKINRSFEGGQTPIIRRLPKFGCQSNNFSKKIVSIGLSSILKEKSITDINLEQLKKTKIVCKKTKYVKVIMSKDVKKINYSIKLSGISVSKKVRNLIEIAGGEIQE